MPNNEEELLEESVETEKTQPVDEDPAFSGGSLLDNLINKKGKKKANKTIDKAIAKLTRKAIMLLFSNPYFWIIAGIGLLIFFVALLLFGMDFDLAGTGEVEPNYYETTCNNIYLAWENEDYTKNNIGTDNYRAISNPTEVDLSNTERFSYETYDYDSYIAGVIWGDNNAFGTIDNDIVYEAMAIAARTRLIRALGSNCVILRDYNPDKNFVKLTGNEELYTEITEAVSRTKGMMVELDGNLIDAKYDAFSYIDKEKDEDENRYFYHMMNKNEQGQQVILADWVKEQGINPTWVPSSTYLSSLSLYGSKYLLEKADSQYTLYRILEYYYGRNIKYRTIDYAFSNEYNSDCSDINMKSTTLTKDDFIAKVSTMNNSKAAPLIENAGTIYDMGISNGVNPELVFIRASVEGYSPGGERNNYWGIGCTNTGGLEACDSYSSISEGVLAFMNIVKKYNNLIEFAGKYAHLGDYWYNPGSSGLGGCYYAEYIYDVIPEHVVNACAEGKSCTKDNTANCVATTEEDRHAYLVFQAQKMVKARKTIFGLDADTCVSNMPIGEPGSGNCTIWKQGDSRWRNIKLGKSSLTMGNSGCAVTSIAIAMSCSGTTINNVATFNPGTFVNKLNQTGGFTETGGIYWGAAAIGSYAQSFKYKDGMSLKDLTDKEKIERVNSASKENGGKATLLLHFVNDKHPRGHWVVLKSISGSNFTVYDPAGNEPDVNTYAAKYLDDVRIYYF